MTVLRKKFNNLKKILKKENYILQFEGNNPDLEYDLVQEFFKNRKISSNMINEFYATECTGYTVKEIKEYLFKGKKKDEVRKLKDAIKEAVKYKLICELKTEE